MSKASSIPPSLSPGLSKIPSSHSEPETPVFQRPVSAKHDSTLNEACAELVCSKRGDHFRSLSLNSTSLSSLADSTLIIACDTKLPDSPSHLSRKDVNHSEKHQNTLRGRQAQKYLRQVPKRGPVPSSPCSSTSSPVFYHAPASTVPRDNGPWVAENLAMRPYYVVPSSDTDESEVDRLESMYPGGVFIKDDVHDWSAEGSFVYAYGTGAIPLIRSDICKWKKGLKIRKAKAARRLAMLRREREKLEQTKPSWVIAREKEEVKRNEDKNKFEEWRRVEELRVRARTKARTVDDTRQSVVHRRTKTVSKRV